MSFVGVSVSAASLVLIFSVKVCKQIVCVCMCLCLCLSLSLLLADTVEISWQLACDGPSCLTCPISVAEDGPLPCPTLPVASGWLLPDPGHRCQRHRHRCQPGQRPAHTLTPCQRQPHLLRGDVWRREHWHTHPHLHLHPVCTRWGRGRHRADVYTVCCEVPIYSIKWCIPVPLWGAFVVTTLKEKATF